MSEVAIVTVSEKGQIVLPKKIRDMLKIGEGTKLFVEEKRGQITLHKIENIAADAPYLLSHEALADDWLSKEDEEAWKDL